MKSKANEPIRRLKFERLPSKLICSEDAATMKLRHLMIRRIAVAVDRATRASHERFAHDDDKLFEQLAQHFARFGDQHIG